LPQAGSLTATWRLDGVLQALGEVPTEYGPNVVARLKVLAGLLTYESSLPQEGRIRSETFQTEFRVSTFPTLYGERAVIRLLRGGDAPGSLSQLGLPARTFAALKSHLAATSGAILIVGPAGSGKTTTAYACLRHIVAASAGGRGVATLEDPIEAAVDGVAQTQVNLAVGFDMATGLRSLLRLDPEVILIGEMRDRATAEIALQAALTGQLVVTTFHAGNCGEAVQRLIDWGIPEYAVRSAVRLIVAQRLIRRLCTCARVGDATQDARPLGLEVTQSKSEVGCESCHGTGYRGRGLIAECRDIRGGAMRAVRLTAGGTGTTAASHDGLWMSAAALVQAGVTSPSEVIRALGWREYADDEESNILREQSM
jgi:type II secretory ATPase GspE/PulE/Tfp pilus assembly ATPase PilB-like protein